MANGFDPAMFDFKKQTAGKGIEVAGSGLANDWGHLWQLGGVEPWQMKFDDDDITLAQRQGASPYQIQQLLTEAGKRPRHGRHGGGIGLLINPKVHTWLAEQKAKNPDAFNAPIDYGAKGGYGFDFEDVTSMWGAGPGNDAKGNPFDGSSQEFADALGKVRDAKIWAQNQNIGVSGGVDTWIQNKENQSRMDTEAKFHNELLAQQQAAAEAQAKIQREAAAQAARVKGSSPTGVGGAASIKGSRLSITEGKGRKGTKQFSRPTEYLNTLGIGGGGATSRSSTVTL